MPHRPSAPGTSSTTTRAERVAADGAARHARVRQAAGPRYGPGTGYRPDPLPEQAVPTGRPAKNKIHSILSALPVIMLASGLYLYYRGESAQSHGAPIRAESVELRGAFGGLSVVKSGGAGRHYLWVTIDEHVRGTRILPAQREALEALAPGDELRLQLAPTVSGSSTLWVWRVERDGVTLVDDSARLH